MNLQPRQEKIRRTLMLAMLLGVLAMMVGCQPRPTEDPEQQPTSSTIATAESQRKSAIGDVVAAVPHTSKMGKPLLTRATVNLTDQGVALALAERQNVANMKGWRITVRERNEAWREKDALKADFWSYRQRQWMWWIKVTAVSIVALWVGLGALAAFYLPVGPAKFIIRLLPFANIFSRIRRRREGE